MENQKIINLLNKTDTKSKNFATKKWYIINDLANVVYGVDKNNGTGNPALIQYETKVLKSNLCDYADAYILVTGKIRMNANNARTALKNCAPFTKRIIEINDEQVETANDLNLVMPMYNLIEYSDNCQDSSATLYQYKRNEPLDPDAALTDNNSESFKYKLSLLGNPVVANNISTLEVKVVVPLKYLSNLFRSLEMPLINCKVKLNLT